MGDWGALAKNIKETAKKRKEGYAPGDSPDMEVEAILDLYDHDKRLFGVGAVELGEVYDETSGALLDPVKVKEARKTEMKTYSEMKVYTKVPIQQCYDETGKEPIGTRWVDVNRGTTRRRSTGAGL